MAPVGKQYKCKWPTSRHNNNNTNDHNKNKMYTDFERTSGMVEMKENRTHREWKRAESKFNIDTFIDI